MILTRILTEIFRLLPDWPRRWSGLHRSIWRDAPHTQVNWKISRFPSIHFFIDLNNFITDFRQQGKFYENYHFSRREIFNLPICIYAINAKISAGKKRGQPWPGLCPRNSRVISTNTNFSVLRVTEQRFIFFCNFSRIIVFILSFQFGPRLEQNRPAGIEKIAGNSRIWG